MNSLKKEFNNILSGIAWSLWKELGVAGVENFHTNCLVQPEEVIILTMILAKDDPRLRNEALDWCSRYHELISISRLRTLLKQAPSDALQNFSQFVADLNFISSAVWPGAAESHDCKIQISKKSSLSSFDSPSLLLLRLRSLFGPGIKSDVLAHFLIRNQLQFSAADLVELGYSKRSIMTALDNMAASGIISVTNVQNKKIYELKRSKELQILIGRLPKIAPPWNKILQAIIEIQSKLPELENSSETTKGVILRNCLITIEPLLPYFISFTLNTNPDFKNDWKALIELFGAFQHGNFFMQYEVFDELDKLVVYFLLGVYPLEDSVDGITTIEDMVRQEHSQHTKVYKECYQLFLSFIGDLKIQLKHFLEFPFHKMRDEFLADIPYQFSKDKLTHFYQKVNEIKPIDQITNAQIALRQYQLFTPEIIALRQLTYSFRKRLEDLYFVQTDIHLLSQPESLHKRHLVLDLFS